MWNGNRAKLTRYSHISATLIAIGFIASSADRAMALTADDVMNKMKPEERTAYLAGAVEAFAQARWIADKPDADGMRCIHNWFYARGEETRPDLFAFLSKHLDNQLRP